MYEYKNIQGKHTVLGDNYNTTFLTEQIAREAATELNALYLSETKLKKIKDLNTYIDTKLQAYLSKYPEVEKQSFPFKKQEAREVQKNQNLPLEDTPVLAGLTGNTTIENRNALALAVQTKVAELTTLEAFAVQKREAIKQATTKTELEAITWE